MIKRTGKQQGFGLVEVLITLVVIAIGILAHISFQRLVFRDTNSAEARSNAVELAAEKLEDLRGFSQLETESGKFAYQDIANNAGGTLGQGTTVIGNTTYNRSWSVKNWYYTAPGTAPTQTVPTGSPLPGFKQITVTVQWVDVEGNAESLNLHSTIAGLDPARASRIYQ